MVIVDDKPHNWPAPPPPYIRTSDSRPGEKSSSSNSNNNRAAPSGNLLSPTTPNQNSRSIQRIHFADNLEAARSTTSFTSQAGTDPPPFPHPKTRITLLDLPQHILLYIVQLTCLPSKNPYSKKGSSLGVGGGYGVSISDEDEWADHAVGLLNLATSVRLVNRALYVGEWLYPLPK